MSQQYDNTNRFALWKNTEKKNPKGPDYSGTLNVDGEEYFIDGWINDSDSGPRLSGSIKLKDKQPGKQRNDL